MSIVSEFKEFINKGSVMDLAVGVIVGGAFGKITASLVEDIFMPIIGRIVGSVDFSNLYLPLSDKIPAGTGLADAKKLGPVFAYGNFITVVINFLLVAFAVFLFVKAYNKMKAAPAAPAAPPEPTATEKLLTEIRDALKR
jgi:large conductance mechanosensitive channel